MNTEQFNKVIEDQIALEKDLLKRKGNDYTTNDDRLSNFKEVAKLLGVHHNLIICVYLLKQVCAIMTFVRDGKVESEPIEQRIADARNYLGILLASVKEEQDDSTTGK